MTKKQSSIDKATPIESFKLLAIRPLESNNESFLRILKAGTIYKLYQNVDLITKGKEEIPPVVAIVYKEAFTDELYNTKNGKIIGISAIVGKNGSGKSSIVEAMYTAIYNLSFLLKVIPEKTNEGTKRRLENGVNIELYYRIKDTNYKLTLNGRNVKIQHQKNNEKKLSIAKKPDTKFLADFFYSIVINYSHHALNSKHLGDWVRSIFHKNDGYQTPIVLNPFRDEGNIDINKEEDLTYSRLISNTLFIPEGHGRIDRRAYRELIDTRIVEQLKITINDEKLQLRDTEPEIVKTIDENREEMFKTIMKYFKVKKISKNNSERHDFFEITSKYLAYKFYKTSIRYKPFKDNPNYQYIIRHEHIPPPRLKNTSLEKHREWLKNFKKFTYSYDPSKFDNFIQELSNRPSHYSFKLQQALNFINNIRLYKSKIGEYFPINDLARPLNAQAKREKKELISLIPPSFFKVEIKFNDGGLFSGLSSGEKQQIFSSASYMYHLINLNSVIDDKDTIRYKYVNLVFDEIELYYHPDLQRTFISNFVKNIERLSIPNIKAINCIFITHSPFILSDIPTTNILFLIGKAVPMTNDQLTAIDTFGANIHDILKHSFFLENGSMGEFVKQKITGTINYINREQLKNELLTSKGSIEAQLIREKLKKYSLIDIVDDINYHKEMISIIGEPILRRKLQDMLIDILPEESEIKKQRNEMRKFQKSIDNSFKRI